jgi:pimeloyl-ACP methyl ester carboxylesterase
MGSKLRDPDTKEILWVDFSTVSIWPWKWGSWLGRLLDRVAYPNKLEPMGIMDQVIFVPPWARQEHYNRLIEALDEMGYKLDKKQCFGYEGDVAPYDESKLNCYAFPYDWRQDNRESARELGRAVERWRSYHPGAEVWIIAHSNGGLVARWYIEKEGGKEFVKRLFLMGSPWDGTPKAMHMAFSGVDTLFRRSFNLFGIADRTRQLVRTFPSIYQLIPSQNPFLTDLDNEQVDPFAGDSWLEDESQRKMLESGRKFSEELGSTLTPHTVCIFGTRQDTPTSGRVRFGAANSWASIEWANSEAGDGTIPARSASNPDAAELIPYPVNHGNIYVDRNVLEKLRFELIDKFRPGRGGVRAIVLSGNMKVVFEPDREDHVYSTGETVGLWATVEMMGDAPGPVSNASIYAQPVWHEALPGSTTGRPAANLPRIRLLPSKTIPGRYEAAFVAPEAEGYYQLQAKVKVKGQPPPPLTLEELILVEAAVDIRPPEQAEAGDGDEEDDS